MVQSRTVISGNGLCSPVRWQNTILQRLNVMSTSLNCTFISAAHQLIASPTGSFSDRG